MIDHLFSILRAHPELALFLALGIGYAVGKITIFGVTIGAVTGCLLAGVLIGQTGAVLSNDVKQAFFLLFLFAIGYRTGPQFFQSLNADALPHEPGPVSPPPERPVHRLESIPERSLVFESQGRLFGLPLPFISQVVMRGPAFSALPGRRGAVAGVMPHGQTLWPLYSAPALLGAAPASAESFLVLAEVEGRGLGLCASRVLGVHPRFVPAGEPGEFNAPGVPAPVLFLDLRRMFS